MFTRCGTGGPTVELSGSGGVGGETSPHLSPQPDSASLGGASRCLLQREPV